MVLKEKKLRKIKMGAVLGVSVEDTSQLFDPPAPFLHIMRVVDPRCPYISCVI